MRFFICHLSFQNALCDLAYSLRLNPYKKENIYWGNKCFEFKVGGEHFFDWVVDGEIVSGVELHLLSEDLLSPRRLFERSSCLTWDGGFATIRFTEGRSGRPKFEPDWESFFYKSRENDWIVALGTNFLSTQEVDSLRKLCVDYAGGSVD